MTWRRSIDAAIRDLRKEEAELVRELDLLRGKIAELERLGEGPDAPGARRARGRRKSGPRRQISEEGRRAISQAAKRRWARYRAEQDKPE